MKKTLGALFQMITTPRGRRVVIYALIVMLAGLCVTGVIMVRRAQAAARWNTAVGRLYQMAGALRQYEYDYETLPPLCLNDTQGRPSQSWRALILPCLGLGFSKQLDLSQPWNSDFNHRIIDSVPPRSWGWFAQAQPHTSLPASTHILAYLGRESIWDARTGLPKGSIRDHPGAIMLVSVPKSNLHPMQPGDITEEEVRERVGKGEEVFFIAAGDTFPYGIVTIERGELGFHTW